MVNFFLTLSPSDIIILIVALCIIGALFIAVRRVVMSILDIDTIVEKRITINNMLLKEQSEKAETPEEDKVYESSTTAA
ncbi:hypothetical protein GZH53_00860 [Flavihumibacter sp. R14]|nr:hypothetical protein [Flavihumibacter soli]